MPLYIRDDDVAELARQLQEMTKARTMTDAVRLALHNEMTRMRAALPLKQRLAGAKALADAMGPTDPAFDMKKFADEMWGERDVR